MDDGKRRWLDRKRNVSRIFWGLGVVCGISLAAGPIWIHAEHTRFGWEGLFGFYGLFGFVACVLLVLAAKHLLRPIVKRDEDYYDR